MYWVSYDKTMQELLEHVIHLFAKAAFDILLDPESCMIDLSKPQDSLPYLILNVMNQHLMPANMQSMTPGLVKSIAKTVVSVFALMTAEGMPVYSVKSMAGDSLQRPPSPGWEIGRGAVDGNQHKDNLNANDTLKISNCNAIAKSYLEALWLGGWKAEIVQLVKQLVSIRMVIVVVMFHICGWLGITAV
jgi:hypothetical protein